MLSSASTNREKLQKFYNENIDSLSELYPGITFERLIQEFESSWSKGPVERREILKDCYLEGASHPLNTFFSYLKKGIPLEYISGQSYFYKSEFRVTPDVLIPRSETEILVEIAVNYLKSKSKEQDTFSIADIGTGSGNILLSILQEVDCPCFAIGLDISPLALAVAKKNHFNLKYRMSPKHHVEWIISDRMGSLYTEDHRLFDLIVSNPPYIKEKYDRKLVHHKVDQLEPHSALYLKDEEYDQWFALFFQQVENKLRPGGMFIMEGHEHHLESLRDLAQSYGLDSENTEIINDYTGRPRFFTWKRKNG